MSELFLWVLVLAAVWLAFTPVAFLAFPNLMDRGFGLVRPVGMLVTGSTIWVLSLVRVFPNEGWAWWAVVGVIGASAWVWVALKLRGDLLRFVKARWFHLTLTEFVFLGFFCLFALLKAMDPDISHTEKPMDLMMLNAVTSDPNAPPTDLWLSGFPIAYYYFGYWMFGGIAQMAGVVPHVAFNLALATVAGASAAAIFSLVSNLVRRDGGTLTQVLAASGGGVLLLLCVSNLNGMWELLSHLGIGTTGFYEWLGIKGVDLTDGGSGWRPEGWWWWWSSSRVINTFTADGTGVDFTIQEFPFFSLMLGDLHPHLMSIPFVLLSLTLLANLVFSRDRWGWGWFRSNPVTTPIMVLAFGASGFINSWDLGWTMLAVAAVVFFKSYVENRREYVRALKVAAPPLIVLGLVGFIFFSNFYVGTMQSQIQFPPLVPTKYGTRAVHFLTVWGALLALVVGFATRVTTPIVRRELAAYRSRLSLQVTLPPFESGLPWAIALTLVIAGYILWVMGHYGFNDNATGTDLFTRLVVAAPIALAFVGLFVASFRRWARGADDGAQIVLATLTLSAFLLYGSELFRLHDLFADRHNTVFKFYYQVWIFLAVCGGYGIYYWMRHHRNFGVNWRRVGLAIAIVGIGLTGLSLYYPFAATATKSAESGTRFTLDGLAFLESSNGGVFEAIEWLRTNLSHDDVLLEAPGGGYTHHGRMAGWSGVPGLLGWKGHQSQWRGGDEWWIDRDADITRIYTDGSDAEVQELLARYDVGYVIVGPVEHQTYTDLDDSKFDRFGERVFENEQVTIYALKEQG